jgi:hypothetical protein
VVVGLLVGTGCGSASSDTTSGSDTASQVTTTLPIAPVEPEGDPDAIDACRKALTAPGVDPVTIALMAGFSTTKAVLEEWKQTREPGMPTGVSFVNQPPPDTPLSVCYADGNFLRHGPAPVADSDSSPPTTVHLLAYTREIFSVRPDGTVDGDWTGPREYMPIRRPAKDAEPMNLLAAPGFTIPAELYDKYPDLARDPGAPGYTSPSSSSSS